ncbi:hypothetical protein CcaCcLH18_11991 [Colletotrichum camelliae]|nr:hypothetical protein CcaCcLH18_11991 [Colletotrichum camelliae]
MTSSLREFEKQWRSTNAASQEDTSGLLTDDELREMCYGTGAAQDVQLPTAAKQSSSKELEEKFAGKGQKPIDLAAMHSTAFFTYELQEQELTREFEGNLCRIIEFAFRESMAGAAKEFGDTFTRIFTKTFGNGVQGLHSRRAKAAQHREEIASRKLEDLINSNSPEDRQTIRDFLEDQKTFAPAAHRDGPSAVQLSRRNAVTNLGSPSSVFDASTGDTIHLKLTTEARGFVRPRLLDQLLLQSVGKPWKIRHDENAQRIKGSTYVPITITFPHPPGSKLEEILRDALESRLFSGCGDPTDREACTMHWIHSPHDRTCLDVDHDAFHGARWVVRMVFELRSIFSMQPIGSGNHVDGDPIGALLTLG